MSGGRASLAEGTAGAKGVRQSVPGRVNWLVWLQQHELGSRCGR